jgi:signal transduction histidine kinase/DNA-binding response OmpR family regulator/ligand-binding sensor domain-containing protein
MRVFLSFKLFFLVLPVFCSSYLLNDDKISSFRALSVNEGLSHTDATGIIQDNSGFIWISTLAGLDRFDGYEVKNYKFKNFGIQNVYLNRINDINYYNHKIWIASQEGIGYFDCLEYEFNVPQFDIDVSKLSFTHIKNIDNNRFIAISRGKIYYFKKESNLYKVVKLENNLPFVSCMDILANKTIIIGTAKGIYQFDLKNEKITKIANLFSDSSISAISITKNNEILITDNRSLFSTNISEAFTNNWKITPLYNSTVSDGSDFELEITQLIKDDQKRVWITTPKGLFILNENNVLSKINSDILVSAHVHKMFIDKSSTIWISSYGEGVNYLHLYPKMFNTIKLKNKNANYIRAIVSENNGKVWLGSRRNGLIFYDQNNQEEVTFSLSNGLNSNYIRALLKDSKNRLLVATENGINVIQNNKVIQSITQNDGLTNNVIYCLAKDNFNQIWAGSWQQGLNILVEENGKYVVKQKLLNTEKDINLKITSIFSDPQRLEIFVSTTNGLYHYFQNSDGSLKKNHLYRGDNSMENGMNSNFVWPVLRGDANTLWVGTIGGGVNKLTLDLLGGYKAQYITVDQGLPSNDVESMLMDDKGNIWIGGKGLSRINTINNEITNFDAKDGLQSNIFKIGSSHKKIDGTLYFGGVDGVNYFQPDQIKESKIKSKAIISEIAVNNQIVSQKRIQYSQDNDTYYLNISHFENNILIKFASIDYANSDKSSFRYKLSDVHSEWVEVNSKNRFAAFSNLPYGNYSFQLQCTNHDGIWQNNISTLNFKVNPPFWKTIWAKLFYLLFSIFSVYILYKYYIKWSKLNQSLSIKELEKKNEEELHQLRLQFFTNISHELRTPLSLILSPVENLKTQLKGNEDQTNLLNLVHKNAVKLLNLVNELLDFRKAEVGMIKLRTYERNISDFIYQITSEFEEFAEKKGVKLVQNIDFEKKLWIDPKILTKIITNLLSNAIKYTNTGGVVTVEISESSNLQYNKFVTLGIRNADLQYIWIKIKDTGVGFDNEAMEHLFERFYQSDHSSKNEVPSSGIGLSFVKSLVLAHKGIIKVSSIQNEGSEFLVGLPLGCSHLTAEEIVLIDKEIKEDPQSLEYEKEEVFESYEEQVTITIENLKPKILIAEDNEDLKTFIVSSLKSDYHLYTAENGLEAYNLSKEFYPDVIISDVMMPVMDGFELCEKVKNDIEISHIPVILLTAKSSDDSKIIGSEAGADIYITKPFSIKFLSLSIQNLLSSRRKIKEMFANDVLVETRELATNKREREFLDEIVKIIEENLDNPNLDVDMLCHRIGISRTKLYTKIQAVTGYPIGEFIRKIRLKKAAYFLMTEDITVLEVMDRVGIQSQSYFTKAFKKEFGKTPAKYVQDHIHSFS